MSQGFRLKMAKQKAEAFLRENGINELPVDPFAIAANHDIIVKAKPDVEAGVSGMLLRHGDTFGILYATHIQSEGFQRFSVAHELGHYFLDGHVDHLLLKDGIHSSHAGFVSTDSYELEADHFAAGLLMPAALFRRALGRWSPGLSVIESMAELCHTSLTATAIRYAELSEDAVAVIMSTGSTIDYGFLSNSMKLLPELTWPRKGSAVPAGTETTRFNKSPERIAQAARSGSDIDIMDWLGGRRSIEATEEVVGLGSYGKTLTVLTCPSLVDETYQDDDDEGGENLIDRWTPRFH